MANCNENMANARTSGENKSDNDETSYVYMDCIV